MIRTGEKRFFVFKVDQASVGDYNFSRLPRLWAEDIGEFFSVLMFLFALSTWIILY